MAAFKFPRVPGLMGKLRIEEDVAIKVRAVLTAPGYNDLRAIAPVTEGLRGYTLEQLKLVAVNEVIGGHGIEFVQAKSDRFEGAEYIDMGGTYTPTVVLWRGDLKLTDLGTFIEKSRTRFL